MGTQRAEISRRAASREERRTGHGDTFTCTRCQCTIGMRPNNRAGVTVSFQWTGNPVQTTDNPIWAPSPPAPWIGQWTWLGRDDDWGRGKNSRPPWTMVSVKSISFFTGMMEKDWDRWLAWSTCGEGRVV